MKMYLYYTYFIRCNRKLNIHFFYKICYGIEHNRIFGLGLEAEYNLLVQEYKVRLNTEAGT